MGKIKSDTISAQNAISELVGVDTSDKQNLTKTKNKTIIPRNKIYQEILRQEE